jgi:hypothetical protein
MKKIINFLRKIGVLRFGSFSATYKNAKEMPAEMVTDTFNAEKETITKEDVKKVNDKLSKKNVLFIVSVVIFLFFLLFFLTTNLFSLWSIISIVIWVLFLIKLKNKHPLVSATPFKTIGIVIFLSFISFIFVGLADNSTSSGSKKSSEVVDKKTLTVTGSNNLKGVIGIENLKNGRVRATYNILANTDLPTNWVCMPGSQSCGEPYNEYTYIIDLVNKSDPNNDEGELGPVYCNKDKVPTDPYENLSEIYGFACLSIENSADLPTTDTFYMSFQVTFDDYNSFLAANKINLHDGSAYWYIFEEEILENESSRSWTVDTEKTVKETDPITTFELAFE